MFILNFPKSKGNLYIQSLFNLLFQSLINLLFQSLINLLFQSPFSIFFFNLLFQSSFSISFFNLFNPLKSKDTEIPLQLTIFAAKEISDKYNHPLTAFILEDAAFFTVIRLSFFTNNSISLIPSSLRK